MTTPEFADTEAERDFLAAVVEQQSILDEFDGILEAQDFVDPFAIRAYGVFGDLHQAGTYLKDFGAVLRAMRAGTKITAEAAQSFMGRLAGGIPGSAPYHAGLILDASKKRRLSAALRAASKEILDSDADPAAISQRLEAELGLISTARSVERAQLIADCAAQAMVEIREAMTADRIMGIQSGLHDLDGVFGGWHKTELTMFAGQPGGGKTAFAMQTGRYAAQQGHSVLIASLEMSKIELSRRYLCSDSGIDSRALRTGNLSEADLPKLEASLRRLDGLPLRIWDPHSASMTQIRAEARRVKATHGLDLLILDYLTLIGSGPDTRKLEPRELVGNSARRLKQLSRELEVPVLCLSQVNRTGASSERLKMHHLAESSEVERNADNVIFLNPGDLPGEVIVGVAKQRNGPTGELKIHFDPDRTMFRDSLSTATPFQ